MPIVMPPPRPVLRREQLINGRRVRISDLIEAGLLQPGDILFYRQHVGGVAHQAEVTDRGWLKVADGRIYDTPSGAALAVSTNTVAVAGWAAWRHGVPDGPSLHQLRRRLLRSVAEEVAADRGGPEPEAEAVRRRFDILEEARTKAEAGEPESLTVREFIRLWDFEDRDRAGGALIDADLANHGLITVPDYRAVSLERTIRITVPTERDGEDSAVESADGKPEEPAADVNEESIDIGLTLGNLLSDDNPLVWVSPSATFEEAITVMQINDYSQVAVLANLHTLDGAVSWKSIAQAQHRDPDASFSDAIDRRARARVFDYDTRLLDVLGVLQEEEFIFVRDFERKITGIVTAADVVHKYDETATPFFLVGEIDQELRQLVQNTFDEETIGKACRSAGLTFKSVGSMSIGQYQAVLGNSDCWAQLGWRLNRKVFIDRLNEIRTVRNNVMHFNPDPVKAREVGKLRLFLGLIRQYSK